VVDVEAFVWHDADGNITAVGHAVPGSSDRVVEPLPLEGRGVLRLTMEEKSLSTLHLTHRVDDSRMNVIERDGDAASAT
jgi:hypothetical protein